MKYINAENAYSKILFTHNNTNKNIVIVETNDFIFKTFFINNDYYTYVSVKQYSLTKYTANNFIVFNDKVYHDKTIEYQNILFKFGVPTTNITIEKLLTQAHYLELVNTNLYYLERIGELESLQSKFNININVIDSDYRCGNYLEASIKLYKLVKLILLNINKKKHKANPITISSLKLIKLDLKRNIHKRK